MIRPRKNVSYIAVVKTLSAAALLWASAVGAAAQAGDASISVSSGSYRTPVIELYTSEGCSSCPRADNWISKLGTTINEKFNAVPLAFHVDYWNYLGWEDPFSKAAFTDRQRQLGAINRQRSIYTPEFLVSGEETRGTSAVVEAIEKANADESSVDISLTLTRASERDLRAVLTIDNRLEDGVLYLAVYENNIVREIGGGENNGRTLTYDFVVRHWESIANIKSGAYEGMHPIKLDPDWQPQNLGVAAVVLDRRDSKTLQAVRLDVGPLFDGEKLALLD